MNRKTTDFLAASALLTLVLTSSPSAKAQTPASNQSMGFSQLSTASLAPARLQLKNLGKDWQRLSVEGAENDPYMAMYGGFRGQMMEDVLANAGIGVYFTKGQSVTLGSETFLVAYRVDTKMTAQDIQDMFRNFGGHGREGTMPGPRKFAPDTTLLLSLLNLRTVGSLKDVRPFDAKREIMGPVDVIDASNENLQTLGRLLTQISQRNRYGLQRLPLQNAAAMRQSFDRYFHPRQAIFVHPQTKEPYRTNAVLAKTPMRLVSNRAKVVAIYEAKPGTDGKYGVVFLDGHTSRVPQSQWAAVRAVLPQKPGATEIQALSKVNLVKFHSQIVRYTRARSGKLPSMQNASVLRRELSRTVGGYNASYYNHPVTGESYRPNEALGGKNLRQISNGARLIALYEATPDSEGKRSAIFLDGHVERIGASKWNAARAVKVRLKAQKS